MKCDNKFSDGNAKETKARVLGIILGTQIPEKTSQNTRLAQVKADEVDSIFLLLLRRSIYVFRWSTPTLSSRKVSEVNFKTCYSYNLQSRLLEDARALEKAGYLRPTDKSRVGNSQAFSNNYGFDYAKEQKSREE